MAFVNEVSEVLGESRTVDYEREAVMKPGSEEIKYYRVPGAETFTLTWKGEKIEFGGQHKIDLFEPDGTKARLTYYIKNCVYSENLRQHKAEIIQLILDALHTYGVNFGTQEGTEIVVKIDSDLGNLQLNPTAALPTSNYSKNIN